MVVGGELADTRFTQTGEYHIATMVFLSMCFFWDMNSGFQNLGGFCSLSNKQRAIIGKHIYLYIKSIIFFSLGWWMENDFVQIRYDCDLL